MPTLHWIGKDKVINHRARQLSFTAMLGAIIAVPPPYQLRII